MGYQKLKKKISFWIFIPSYNFISPQPENKRVFGISWEKATGWISVIIWKILQDEIPTPNVGGFQQFAPDPTPAHHPMVSSLGRTDSSHQEKVVVVVVVGTE